MRLLLDTHAWLWFYLGDVQLSVRVEPAHAARVASLPFTQVHKDPFDRLLIAQAISEDIPIISADEEFDGYAVKRLR